MVLSQRDKSILWTFFFVVWTMIWIRAAIIPVFPDEVFSWFLYGESGYFFQPEAQIDANNHFLNSILTWISAKLFGTSAFAIRLPNVFAFVIYFLSVVQIGKFQKTKGGFWISMSVFSGIFYILEFFSLSRGYGLSFAFIALSIWQLMVFQRTMNAKQILLICLGIFLTLASNLSLIFTCATLLVWIIFLLLFAEKSPRQRSFSLHWIFVFISIGVLFVFYRHLSFLNESGMLYYGIENGFPLGTIKTLLTEVFGSDHKIFYFLLLLVFLIIIFAFIFILLRQKIKESLRDYRLVFAVLFFINIAAIAYTVWFMKAVAPSDRTAAHLVILFLGAIVFLKPSFDSRVLISYVQPILLVFPLISLLQFNLKMHHFWREDQLSSRIYDRLEKEVESGGQLFTISGFRYFDRMYAFENTRRANKLPTFDLVSWPDNKSDFLLIRNRDFEGQQGNLKEYQKLVVDNVSGNMLLKRKKRLEKLEVRKEYHHYGKGSGEFFDFVSIKLDGNSSADLIADVRFRFLFEGSGEQFILTSAIVDSSGNQLKMTEHLHLNQLKSDWNNTKLTHFTIPFFTIPRNAAEIKLYLYNDKKVLHGKFNSVATVYSLKKLTSD